MTEGGTSIWQIDTNDHGSDTLDKFADAYKDGDISPRNEFAFAGRYSCGKGCSTTKWKTKSDFNQDSLNLNPQLFTAPIATP